ncbi:hypothetical protein ILUMI_26802 [Ignelater luminosus]|uniref:Uncharacterized protein n=1 Tax=Ignelater luminosus TaxID=2038154 RepID=A0A8K0C428_IGNLU|nr:hypothetical protein ILUMI_26802 [Ignelater luminosus]
MTNVSESSLYIDEPSTSNFQEDISSKSDTSRRGSTVTPHGNLRKDAEEDREGEKHNIRGITENSKQLTRKRIRDPSTWKRNIQKKLRMQGKEYLTQNEKLKRGRNFRDIDLDAILQTTQNAFSSLSTASPSDAANNTGVLAVDARSSEVEALLLINSAAGRSFEVETLLSIIPDAVRSSEVEALLLIKAAADSKLTQSGTTEADKRGKKSSPQQKSEEVKEIIRDHINPLPVISSHYCLIKKNKNKGDDRSVVNWLKIKWLQYRKEDSTRIFFKEKLSDTEFKSVVIKKPSTRRSVSCLADAVFSLYSSSLSIEQKKFETLSVLI